MTSYNDLAVYASTHDNNIDLFDQVIRMKIAEPRLREWHNDDEADLLLNLAGILTNQIAANEGIEDGTAEHTERVEEIAVATQKRANAFIVKQAEKRHNELVKLYR